MGFRSTSQLAEGFFKTGNSIFWHSWLFGKTPKAIWSRFSQALVSPWVTVHNIARRGVSNSFLNTAALCGSDEWWKTEVRSSSIQFRHLYAPANKNHVYAHGEKIYNNTVHEWSMEKKSISCEKVRFQSCSEGVEQESGITQVHWERVPHN